MNYVMFGICAVVLFACYKAWHLSTRKTWRDYCDHCDICESWEDPQPIGGSYLDHMHGTAFCINEARTQKLPDAETDKWKYKRETYNEHRLNA